MRKQLLKTIIALGCTLLLLAACQQSQQETSLDDPAHTEAPIISPYEDTATPGPADDNHEDDDSGIHGLISVVEYGNSRAYIFGSIHVGHQSWYPLSPIVEDAIDRADIFAFEIDMAEDGGPCICDDGCNCGCDPEASDCLCQVMAYLFFEEGVNLETFLPADVHEALMENIGTFRGINPAMLSDIRPVALHEILLYEFVAPALGLSHEYSIDMYVFNRAEERGQPSLGLTDFNDHISFVADMPVEYQIATAKYSINDFDTMLEEMEELAQIYETQDIYTLRQQVRGSMQEAYEYYERGEISAIGLGLARYWDETIGNYRSAFFARQIAGLLTEAEEPTIFFVTVGIAHLSRELNVFHVLEEMGFDVTPLYPGGLR